MGAELKLRALERVANANRSLYVSYLEKFKEISPQEHSQEPDARLLAAASVPLRPSSPNSPMLLGSALLASTGLAVAVALLLGWSRNGLYSVEAIEALGPVRNFGLIPELGRRTHPVELLVDDPISMYPEAVQAVYAALQCSGAVEDEQVKRRKRYSEPAIDSAGDTRGRIVVVSSALPGEGKSVFAASLARCIALAGKKALLLDCDLRHPSVARLFNDQAAEQLSSILAHPNSLSERVIRDGASGLHYIPVATERCGVHAVLNSPQLASMLHEARAHYDYVVIDTPPLLAVCDALLLSKLANMMLLVVRWERTPRAVVGHVLKVLRENKVKLAGVLLTRVNMRKHARYNYGDFGLFPQKVRWIPRVVDRGDTGGRRNRSPRVTGPSAVCAAHAEGVFSTSGG